MSDELFDRIVSSEPPPFALLHRPDSTGPDHIELLVGAVSTIDRIADIPIPESTAGAHGTDTLVLLPYRQIAERGYAAPDDGAPLVAMRVDHQAVLHSTDILDRLPDIPIRLDNEHFDIDDHTYANLVRDILNHEIGSGAGANFVLKRSFIADIADYSLATALTFFSRLLRQESGAYWTFLVHTGERTFIGASPERHISLYGQTATMNPISGTYRYPASGPTLSGVIDFLSDRKEAYELYMVVDEELKMMSGICDQSPQVIGPYLKEMTQLAHTEYFIKGKTQCDVREILRHTLFAPTVIGSPLESASQIISRYEPGGRAYYSGVAALIGRDGHGGRTLDSSILIRTADIDVSGRMTIGVGATLVRDSEPVSEVAETRAKATGLLAALRAQPAGSLGADPRVRQALRARNNNIARFWLDGVDDTNVRFPMPPGKHVLVVDAEDTFTSMITHQLRSLGLRATVRRLDESHPRDGYDLVVMGPGPGDPRDEADPKIARLRTEMNELLAARVPFLAVCLSHQVLSHQLGMRLIQREVPNQGAQKDIDLFGSLERVGFYNSFAVCSPTEKVKYRGESFEMSRDSNTDEVHALRGSHFASVQFHPESVLTQGGERILSKLLLGMLGTTRQFADA